MSKGTALPHSTVDLIGRWRQHDRRALAEAREVQRFVDEKSRQSGASELTDGSGADTDFRTSDFGEHGDSGAADLHFLLCSGAAVESRFQERWAVAAQPIEEV